MGPVVIGGLFLFFFFFFVSGVRIIKEYERGVILRLGRYVETKGPGFKWIIPGIDSIQKVDTRIVARDVPPQDVITKDNVSVKVNAVIYFKVLDCDKAVLKVENYLYATIQYAQTTLRSILGQHEIDDMLSQREQINHSLQDVLDRHTDAWGVKVTSVELKHVDLPPDMQRAMAKQAEAERERRAKVISAAGEFQAATKLAEAALTLASAPGSMTLRYLHTLTEIAVENNSTIAFPVPIDLLQGLNDVVKALPKVKVDENGDAEAAAVGAAAGAPAAKPVVPEKPVVPAASTVAAPKPAAPQAAKPAAAPKPAANPAAGLDATAPAKPASS